MYGSPTACLESTSTPHNQIAAKLKGDDPKCSVLTDDAHAWPGPNLLGCDREARASDIEFEGGDVDGDGIDPLALVVAQDRRPHDRGVRVDQTLQDGAKRHRARYRSSGR